MNRNEHGSLTEEQKIRYRRQLAIPEIGQHGQIRLGKAKVMIVGLGGLGSVSSFYLAAAGYLGYKPAVFCMEPEAGKSPAGKYLALSYYRGGCLIAGSLNTESIHNDGRPRCLLPLRKY